MKTAKTDARKFWHQ